MQYSLINSELQKSDYKDLLDGKNPFDNLILELAEKGELKVGIVEVKEEKMHFIEKYMPNFLFYREKHTS